MKFRSKKASSDFTASMLPQTRKALFFDVVKLQWQNLLLCGLILIIFGIPLLLSLGVEDMFIMSLSQSLDPSDETQLLQAGQLLAHVSVLRSFVNILLIVLLCVAVSGILRVIRQHAWGEHVHMLTDFAQGIRDNFRHCAAVGALAGLIYALCLSLHYFVGAMQTSVMSVLALLPVSVSVLIVLPVFAIALVMIPVYDNPLRITLRNAFAVYAASFWKVLLALVGCLAIWVPALIPNFYCHMLGFLAGLLLTPFSLLAWTLFCHHLFDIHINPTACPELVGRGIVWDFEQD